MTGTTMSREDYVLQNPRNAVWASVMSIVVRTAKAKLMAQAEAAKQRVLEGLQEAMKR
jgi:hypothetical protein